jgi:hypothetical protein
MLMKLKLNMKRILIATVVLWLVGTVFMWLTCGSLFKWIYQIPPLIWKMPAEMSSAGSIVLSNLGGIAHSFVFAMLFAILYKAIPTKGVNKGMVYGFFIWLIGPLTGMMTMPTYMTIAVPVVVYWIFQGLVLNLINGAILGAIYKGK